MATRRESGNGGLERIAIEHPLASGEVYLHGAHVTAWRPPGAAPVLWMSDASHFAADKPIRGGVPICFPWFGAKADDPSAPAHGTARVKDWELVHITDDAAGVTVALRTHIGPFAVGYAATFAGTLSLRLDVVNTSAEPARFEAALHTYLHVTDIRQVEVTGLEGIDYLDSLQGRARVPATGEPIRFAGETDRVYLDDGPRVVVHDPGWRRRIVVGKEGSASTVVWNPWVAKAARMPDFGDDEWPRMLCIETANVADRAVTLAPGAAHAMRAEVAVESI